MIGQCVRVYTSDWTAERQSGGGPYLADVVERGQLQQLGQHVQRRAQEPTKLLLAAVEVQRHLGDERRHRTVYVVARAIFNRDPAECKLLSVDALATFYCDLC